MRVKITVKDGPLAGKGIDLRPPARLSVGRSDADWAFPDDRYLSTRHFEIAWEKDGCVLRDLESANGTFVDGERVGETLLVRACEVVAGKTTFVVLPEINIVEMLATAQPLYAILDAARTPRVLELLDGARERFECLYDGESAVHLASCAPYLVELPPRSRLLRKVVREGWGQSWGVFLVCPRPFEDIRKHFRRFLMVKDEDGADYYFRFYDPRILRHFLRACTSAEIEEFFGPVQNFLFEDNTGLEQFPFRMEKPNGVPAKS